jgi:VWFA-related protein
MECKPFSPNNFLRGVLAALLTLISVASSAQNSYAVPVPVAQPSAHIDLASLGYLEPSLSERLLNDEASLSLDFVDAKHVLLTFNRKQLWTRLPDCPPTHNDRMIHAVIIEIPGGKVVQEADWYLHDRQRYLWPLGDGTFLLRKLNSLYVLDSSLRERLLLDSQEDLKWLTVSANGKQVVLETERTANTAKSPTNAALQSSEKSRSKFLIDFFDIGTRTSQQRIESNNLVHLNASGTGYADVLRKGDLWLIRFGPTPTQRRNIARVRSRCTPEVFYSTSNSLLVGRCSANRADYTVSAFTLTGHRLWNQHWENKRFSLAAARSEDNRRFAVNSFSVSETAGSIPDSHESDADTGPQQNIEIFETASGNPVQSVVATPAMVSAQNFSLSPNGLQFAILKHSQIELYDLPRISEEEQARFTALEADVPGLYIVAKPDSEDTAEAEETSTVAEDTPLAPGPMTALAPAPAPAAASPTSTSSSLSSAEKEVTSQPLATFKASTQAVTVDVVVIDGKGHPVKGLHERDFQLDEDGKAQNLHYFHEFVETNEASPAVFQLGKTSPNVFTNSTNAADTGSVTLILLDLLNTPPADQQFARQQLVKFLKAKPASVQFAICTLSPKKNSRLRLIQGFTPNENLLLAAINSGKATAQTMSWQSAAEARNAVSSVTELAQSDANSHWENLLSGLQKMQDYEQESDTSERAAATIDALSQLARYLAGIPGRKNLVWLSGSFPVAFAPNPELDNPSSESHNYTSLVRQAANLLARGQVTVYPVDVRGLVGADLNAAANNIGIAPLGPQSAIPIAAGQTARDGSFSKPGQMTAVSPNETFQDQTMQALDARSAEFDAMNQLAQGTGGKAFYNTNAIEEAIATAVEQGSNYYTLSYNPANKNYDGKFRKIKVALAEKGYHLHYRAGYFADDPFAPAKNANLAGSIGAAAMQHGSPQSRQILFAVRVVPVGARKKLDNPGKVLIASRTKPELPASVEVQHYAVDFAVDSSGLRFVAQENGDHVSTLSLMMAAYDAEGRQLSGSSSLWEGKLKPAAYKDVLSGGVRLEQQWDVPAQAASLRLGIVDQASNFLGTVELPLPVPVPTDVPRIVKHSLPEIEPD